jgi:hypothetical protein
MDAFSALDVGHEEHLTAQEPDQVETLLAIAIAIIFFDQCWSVKDRLRATKSRPCLRRLLWRFVSFQLNMCLL